MSKQCPDAQRRSWRSRRCVTPGHAFGSLQFMFWVLWTTAVLGCAYRYVRPALHAQEPVDLAGLVIHCALAGLIGMLVLTLIELQLEPWRFIDEGDA